MRKALIPVVVIAAAIGGWFWWSRHNSGAANEIVLHGNVDIRQISLAFDGSGRIAKLAAEEGDRVTAGQIVGLLDTETLELQARQQEANVEAQRQTLLRLRNGSRPEEIAQVRAQLVSAEAAAERTETEFARASRLLTSGNGIITQKSFDQARADAQAAKAKVEEVRASLRLVEIGPRVEEVAAAEAQLKAAEASLALLRHQIELGKLKSPADAVVRSRLHEPGDMITSQQPVLALALTDPKWIRVYVSETDLGKIKPGMTAQVFTDSHPNQPVSGKVGYISSVAEFTPKSVQTEELRTNLVYEVRVIVEDAGNVLRLGQPGTVRIPIETAP